jgi:RNA polymerase sigma-70 factor (ECF subfamily)
MRDPLLAMTQFVDLKRVVRAVNVLAQWTSVAVASLMVSVQDAAAWMVTRLSRRMHSHQLSVQKMAGAHARRHRQHGVPRVLFSWHRSSSELGGRKPGTPTVLRFALGAAMQTQQTPASVERLTDNELIERIRRGQPRAMEALIRRHNRMLYRTARAILRDDAEAEDVVQETYVQAYRSLATFRGESKLSTWLVRIAANKALMQRRRSARAVMVVPIDTATANPDEGWGDQMANEAGPEDETLRGEMRMLLDARIDELPDGYRAVFVLRAVKDFSVKETATALGIPGATVRTRYFRARNLLRESLAREIHVFALGWVRLPAHVAIAL